MKCSKCKGKENLMKFAVSSDGRQLYYCRVCQTERVKKYRQTEVGRKNINKAVAKSIKKHSQKQNARVMTHYYLAKGVIKKADKCEECDSKKTLVIHHNTYKTAFDITWLCKECHLKRHMV